jgi:hypothetical protein
VTHITAQAARRRAAGNAGHHVKGGKGRRDLYDDPLCLIYNNGRGLGNAIFADPHL